VINAAVSPDEKEIAAARRVIDAFASAKGAGAVQLDGRMLDKPHLTQAQKLLQLAAHLRR
jgi:citrate lyase subunit beta/citryl-CoA lyase